MNIFALNNTLALISRLIDARHTTEPLLKDFHTNKPLLPEENTAVSLPRATPEEEGIPSGYLAQFVRKLREDETLNMHSLLILRHGKLLYSCGFGEQRTDVPKLTFSACKSVTSLAIGMLCDEGKLSVTDKIVEIFSGLINPINRVKFKDLTVEDVLTMRSGVVFNEIESMTEGDWVKSYFNSAIRGIIGKTFNYNSLNTYLLSAIVKRVSGEGLMDYLRPRLFAPLGITDIYWETCPKGLEKGGWGLYILPEDFTKIGQLVMQDGVWEGKRLISEEYLRAATTAHAEAPTDYGEFNYGYQIWVGRHERTFLFNGMLGQNVLGFRESGILLVTNAGNGELFQSSAYFRYALEMFSGAFRDTLPEDPAAQKLLREETENLRLCGKETLTLWDKVCGKKQAVGESFYRSLSGMRLPVHSPDAVSTGLPPLMLQAIQNNYTRGCREISFAVREEKFLLCYREEDIRYEVPFSFESPVESELNMHGDRYRVSAFCEYATDEDDRPVLKFRVAFLETPFTRCLRFYFDFPKRRVVIRQTEMPGAEFILEQAARPFDELSEKPIIGSAFDKLDEEYRAYRVGRVLAPRMEAAMVTGEEPELPEIKTRALSKKSTETDKKKPALLAGKKTRASIATKKKPSAPKQALPVATAAEEAKKEEE